MPFHCLKRHFIGIEGSGLETQHLSLARTLKSFLGRARVPQLNWTIGCANMAEGSTDPMHIIALMEKVTAS